ncbi:hypothetical protein [Sphingomonas prati]|uniref:DUF1648 domain-containing protein n=1 Tax=Sphingomonas prati TaxID=1843237 RepID=A0A7W9BUP0_9SPHN|nr:hypothetical protein [Sphingomonas prati]MBB5730345.1 hypothetical protein [Sphingomonas prati]GGE93404.1 hypothetical protein GCM10011404_27970 [Sphingomonas prati]
MTIVLIGIFFGLVLCGVALRAEARFRSEDRLPMQWWLDGEVTWSAPRWMALAFIPALSILMLVGVGVLLSNTRPRLGQEGMVIPSFIALGTTLLAAQFFHLWMVAKTVRWNGS